MKIALLKAGLNPEECLNGFEYQEFALSARESSPPYNFSLVRANRLIDYDLFIVDIRELNLMDSIALDFEANNIHDAIRSGAILICFASEIKTFNKASNFTNYSWFPKVTEIDSTLIENSFADIILVKSFFPFAGFFEKNKLKLSSDCFIKPELGGMSYDTILTDKGERPVGLHKREHKGHIFILPRVEKKESFIKSFISNVLPAIPVVFQLESFSSFEIPEYAKKYLEKIPGIKDADEEIKVVNGTISQEHKKRKEKMEKKAGLEKWVGLIWLKDIPLQRIVGDAFEFLGLEVERPPETEQGPDLRVKYEDTKTIVEVEGSKNAITIEKGRQVHQWLTAENADVKGVLVGNPFNESPIEDRPPDKSKSLFTKDLKEFAEARDFSLVLSTDLFNLVCGKLKGQEIDLQKLINQMYEGKGAIKLQI